MFLVEEVERVFNDYVSWDDDTTDMASNTAKTMVYDYELVDDDVVVRRIRKAQSDLPQEGEEAYVSIERVLKIIGEESVRNGLTLIQIMGLRRGFVELRREMILEPHYDKALKGERK